MHVRHMRADIVFVLLQQIVSEEAGTERNGASDHRMSGSGSRHFDGGERES